MTGRTCCALILLLLAGTFTFTFAENNTADSSAYVHQKNKITLDDSLLPLIETADALAGQGLYAEAIEMLLELGPLQTAVVHKKQTGQWRLSTGADYYRLEDVDTAIMTQEKLQEYRRLTETPFSVWARIKYETDTITGFLDKVSPDLYISGYKCRFEIPVLMQTAEKRISMEAALKTEKWFQYDASGQGSFEPFEPQQSDMGGGYFRIALASDHLRNTGLNWTIPFFADLEHFRGERPGYESHADFRITPDLEYRFGKAFPLSTRLTGETRFDDYYKNDSASLSAVRIMARLENFLSCRDGIYANLNAMWTGDHFINTHIPADINRWESSFFLKYKIPEFAEPSITIKGVHENEKYGSKDSIREYSLSGTEMSVRPSAVFQIFRSGAIEPELTWKRRWARPQTISLSDHFLWKAYTAWEPGVRISHSFSSFDISFRAGYMAENVDKILEQYNIRDSRSIKAGVDGNLSLSEMLSVNLIADYQYCLYEPYGTAAHQSENISISGSFMFKW
jgi:hypothetical protein